MPKKDASPFSEAVLDWTRSFKHGTGEASLAGLRDDGSERPSVRTWEVPGL